MYIHCITPFICYLFISPSLIYNWLICIWLFSNHLFRFYLFTIYYFAINDSPTKKPHAFAWGFV